MKNKKIYAAVLIFCMVFGCTASAYAGAVNKRETLVAENVIKDIEMDISLHENSNDLALNVVEDAKTKIIELTMIIKNEEAVSRALITYGAENEYNLYSPKDYEKVYMDGVFENASKEESIIYLVDPKEGIVGTLGDFTAIDALGRTVDISVEIVGNSISYELESLEDIEYPVTVTTNAYPIQYKYEYINTFNTQDDIEHLAEARDMLEYRENSLLSTLINLTNSIFGLFSVYTGVLSIIISGAITSNADYLDHCRDMYADIIIEYALDRMNCALITYSYKGTYQGKNKGYVYIAQLPTWEANKAMV